MGIGYVGLQPESHGVVDASEEVGIARIVYTGEGGRGRSSGGAVTLAGLRDAPPVRTGARRRVSCE